MHRGDREVSVSFRIEQNQKDIRLAKNAEICEKALIESELLNLEDSNDLLGWLKLYMNLYYEYSELSSRLIRSPLNCIVSDPYIKTEHKMQDFFLKYEVIKKRFDNMSKG